jgi:hypothetical protein
VTRDRRILQGINHWTARPDQATIGGKVKGSHREFTTYQVRESPHRAQPPRGRGSPPTPPYTRTIADSQRTMPIEDEVMHRGTVLTLFWHCYSTIVGLYFTFLPFVHLLPLNYNRKSRDPREGERHKEKTIDNTHNNNHESQRAPHAYHPSKDLGPYPSLDLSLYSLLQVHWAYRILTQIGRRDPQGARTSINTRVSSAKRSNLTHERTKIYLPVV